MIRNALRAAAQSARAAHRAAQPAAASSLPELCLDHLLRMTDDTGIIQHATYSVPARRTGYCVDDNARALIVAVHADRVQASADTRALVTTYLSYLHGSQETDGSFRNFMSYERVARACAAHRTIASGARSGRWASRPRSPRTTAAGQLAREMFARALPHARELGPRGTAQAILGLVSVLGGEPGCDGDAQRARSLGREARRALSRPMPPTIGAGSKPTLTYDNAILPLALFAAYDVTGDRATLRVARESLEFLEDVCFDGDRLQLVGNTGWHSRGGEKADADEQAIDAAAFVLAFRCAYTVTQDRHYLRRMRESFAWFLGANRLGAAAVRLRHGRLPRRHGRGGRQSEPRRREHDLLPDVAAQDARARRRGARARRRGTMARRVAMKSIRDHAHSPSPLARRPPRARQAVPSRRGNSAARPVARASADGADPGDSRSRSEQR